MKQNKHKIRHAKLVKRHPRMPTYNRMQDQVGDDKQPVNAMTSKDTLYWLREI